MQSSLNEEQRRRAEENRQKALAKRRAAQQATSLAISTAQGGHSSGHSATNVESVVRGNSVAGKFHSTPSQTTGGKYRGEWWAKQKSAPALDASVSGIKHSQISSSDKTDGNGRKKFHSAQNTSKHGPLLKEKAGVIDCHVVSKSRFAVQLRPLNCSAVLDVFRTIPSRNYGRPYTFCSI